MMPTRQALRWIAGISALCIALIGYSYFIEPRRLVINEQTLAIPALDPTFDGLRIVALSDIHAGSNAVDAQKLRRIVDTVNAQNADLVVMLGDYVSTRRDRRSLLMSVDELTENLVGMRARYGVFAVLGNHDGFYSDADVASGLKQAGYRVLENEIVTIERNGRPLRIFGLKDHLQLNSWYTFDQMVRSTVTATGGAGDFIVLEHSPDIFHVLNYHKSLGDDFRLMIAGHTHGGQMWLPIAGSPFVPSSFGQKYNRGHIREEGRDMFVTTGIGTSIFPFRFLMPPEIAVITLRSGRSVK